MDTKSLGRWGEDVACGYLEDKGLKILGRNVVLPIGEIDIVAKKKWHLFLGGDTTIHFVEVKTLAGNGEDFYPEQHVDFRKQKKLRQLAAMWLNKNRYRADYSYQIDIVGIVRKPDGVAEVSYFPNAVADGA